MAKMPKKQAVLPQQSVDSMAKAKYDTAKAAKRTGQALAPAVDAGEGEVVRPIAPTKKRVKTRFVRERKVAEPRTVSSVLPPRSTSATARLMSKGLALPPKENKTTGPKPME